MSAVTTIRQGLLFGETGAFGRARVRSADGSELARELRAFREFGRATEVAETRGARGDGPPVLTFRNEFWTARQRAAHSLHEVSYRACFKPALPRFFVERLTAPGDLVHDPFAGRGTAPLEAALLGRRPHASDVNPLTRVLFEPRLRPPVLAALAARLRELDLESPAELPEDLLVFYHPDTLREIVRLRDHFLAREAAGELDAVDAWLRMVAVNRLTGHSPGFLSVYTLPPNQAVSVESQRKINARRGQEPPRRDVRERLLRKSRALLADVDDALRARLAALVDGHAVATTAPADDVAGLPDGSVRLVVTSPPFLDVVQYASDNWLRCWFCGIDAQRVAITQARKVGDWEAAMTAALRECRRALRDDGHVAFEVGEVRGGATRLEEHVIDSARDAGLVPLLVLIQEQRFTKTANCWGIDNNARGTNTNRVVVLRREG
ncbi:MAG: site-specific DNA-methyltransferase [Planctomycetes bacterium]|nr:site-specific DNA-methyltransferase [Planctomycetota bacterium]